MRNKFKLIVIAVILLITPLLQSTPVSANLLNITTEESGVISTGYFEAINNRGWAIQRRDGIDFKIIKVNGVPAFCIEPELHVGDGDGYTMSDFTHGQREMFARIIYHGYDNTNKSNKNYVITQSVLWEYLETVRDDLVINGNYGFQGIDYEAEKQALWAKVNEHNTRASFHNTTVKLKTGESITLTDTNGVISQSTVNSSGLDVTISGNTVTIKATADSPKSAKLEFKKYGNITSNSSTSAILYSHPTLQNLINSGNPDPIPFIVNVEVEHNGTLQIGKINAETQEPVSNTTFELSTHQDMRSPTRYTTGTNGFTSAIELSAGTYYYREISVPSPLIVDNTIRPIEIKAGQQTQVSVSNEVAKGQIGIEKRDAETNEVLTGAQYTIYSDASLTHVVETMTTNSLGLATSQLLPLGHYYIKESQAPQGYLVNEQIYSINISYKDQNTKVILENLGVTDQVIKGKIQIVKVEPDQQTPIQGAVFTVKDANNILIEEITTNEDGFAFTSDLRYGQYFVQEKKAPFGFWQDNTVYPLSILEDGVTVVKYVANKHIEFKLQVIKEDIETKKPLQGAVFEIRDLEDNVISFDYLNDDNEVVSQTQLITNSKGIAITQGFLRVGTYQLIEVKAPAGYLRSAPVEFTVSQDTEYVDLPVLGYTTTQTIGNQATQVEIIKLSENTGEPLGGATLQLINKTTNEVILEWISDEEPLLFKGLEIGSSYIVKEVKAPEGYFTSDPLEFMVEETNELQTVILLNELIPEIKTKAFFGDGQKEQLGSEVMTVIDTVEYSNLVIGKEYTLKGKLLITDTQEIIAENEVTFTAETKDGHVELEFKFDGSLLLGKKIVVFEDLYRDLRHVASHNDLTDTDQTVWIPNIKTSVSIQQHDPKNFYNITLVDVITFENLTVGKEYTIQGIIMDKATREPLLINDKEVTGSATFSPLERSGTTVLSFNLDISSLDKGDYVVFEEIYDGERLVAVHQDIEDKDQTFTIYKLNIHKTDKESKKVLEGVEFTLLDNNGNKIELKNTDEHGMAHFILIQGVYQLVESKALPGYESLQEAITVEANEDLIDFSIDVFVENESIPDLPATGVESMALWPAVGLILVGLVLVLRTTLKMDKEESENETL